MISQRAELLIMAFSVKVYQALLVAYPAKFQQEYGSEMSQVFRDCCLRALHQGGTNGIVRLWAVTLLDLIQSVISEHRRKEIEMKKEMKTEDIQLAGWALIWGAVAFIIAEFLLATGCSTCGSAYIGLINCLSMPLVVVGLLAVRNRYGEKAGGFGKNILLTGSILAPILSLIGFFVFAFAYEGEFLWLLFNLGPAVLFACLALFGFVALYKKPLPRWNVAPAIAGVCYPTFIMTSMSAGDWGRSFGTVIPVILSIIQGMGLVALGYILKSDASEARTAPA
jgi:hypothetical protein